jgi:peptidoglycan/xylan/chitin deacetylase (PgdA/CDA1 family)
MAKSAIRRMLVAAGAPAWHRATKGSRLRILMYHRFSGEQVFLAKDLSRQFAHIRRYYHPISLGEVVRSWQAGTPLPSRSLAITVDDGYADFQNAWPLLKSFDLPATLFVVSGFINRELWLWPDVVHFCLSRSARNRITMTLPDGGIFDQSLATPSERSHTDEALDALLLAMPDECRRTVIARLPEETGVTVPAEVPQIYAPLSWEDLKRMASEGLQVGAHTQTHPVLARISSPLVLRAEIEGSKLAIEKSLGRPVEHFCYPNGRERDFDAGSVEAVRAAGFLSASTARRGLNRADGGLWELRRIGADPSMSADAFELELAGFRMQ